METSNNQNENLNGAEYLSAFRMYDKSSIPVEIFAPDGTAIYANQAHFNFAGIQDASLIIGKYNLLDDPVCNDDLGMREGIRKAFFDGEAYSWLDTIVPIEDLVDRGVIDEKPFESAYIDYHLHPVMDGDKVLYVVFQVVLKRIYQGQPDVAKTKEYIDSHWLDEFDPDTVAKAINISAAHLRTLFKQHAGMTMRDYYNKVKVDHIKDKLADRNLSITEVFDACGVDSQGWIARVFKETTGMSPTEYRNGLK